MQRDIKETYLRFEEARITLNAIRRELCGRFPSGFKHDYAVGQLVAVDTLLGQVGASIRGLIANEPAPAVNLKTGEVHPW